MRKEKETAQHEKIIERTRMLNSASKFVPQQFISFIGKESIMDVKLGDVVQKEMTVLFADIRSFTTLSERLTPAETFAFINEYLALVGPVIPKEQWLY